MVHSPWTLVVTVLASFTISQLLHSSDTPALVTTISDSAANASGAFWNETKCGGLPLTTDSSPYYMNPGHRPPPLWASADLPWVTSFALVSAFSVLSCLLLSPLLHTSTPVHHPTPSDDTSSLASRFQKLRIGPPAQTRKFWWLGTAETPQLNPSLYTHPLPAESAHQLLRPARLLHSQKASFESATARLSLSDRPSQTALLNQLGL